MGAGPLRGPHERCRTRSVPHVHVAARADQRRRQRHVGLAQRAQKRLALGECIVRRTGEPRSKQWRQREAKNAVGLYAPKHVHTSRRLSLPVLSPIFSVGTPILSSSAKCKFVRGGPSPSPVTRTKRPPLTRPAAPPATMIGRFRWLCTVGTLRSDPYRITL